MTRTVTISITVEIAGKRTDVIREEIDPEQIGENLKKVADRVIIFPISCSGREALDVSALAPVNDSVSMEQEDSDLQICVSKCVQSLRNESEPQNGKCVNSAEFIEDVTVPDGTVLSPGEHFRKVL